MEGRHIEKSATQRKMHIHGGGLYTRRDVYTEGTYTWRGYTKYIAYITLDGKSHKSVVKINGSDVHMNIAIMVMIMLLA